LGGNWNAGKGNGKRKMGVKASIDTTRMGDAVDLNKWRRYRGRGLKAGMDMGEEGKGQERNNVILCAANSICTCTFTPSSTF
jgi:hypothetical protein